MKPRKKNKNTDANAVSPTPIWGPWERMSVESHVDWGHAPGLDGQVMVRWHQGLSLGCSTPGCLGGHMEYDWSTFVPDEVQHGPLDDDLNVRNVRTEWSATVLPGSIHPDRDGTDAPAIEAPRKCVGIQAAADYLGMKYDAFEQARKRWKRTHVRIPGEHMVFGQPAWLESDLDAWMASRPRARRP